METGSFELGSGAAYDLSSDSDQNLSKPGYFNYDLDENDVPITDGWRDKNGGAVWALTGQFLEGLDEDGTDDYANVDFDTTNLTFMVNPTSQDLLVLPEGMSVMQNSNLSAVPLPPGLALTLSGLGSWVSEGGANAHDPAKADVDERVGSEMGPPFCRFAMHFVGQQGCL